MSPDDLEPVDHFHTRGKEATLELTRLAARRDQPAGVTSTRQELKGLARADDARSSVRTFAQPCVSSPAASGENHAPSRRWPNVDRTLRAIPISFLYLSDLAIAFGDSHQLGALKHTWSLAVEGTVLPAVASATLFGVEVGGVTPHDLRPYPAAHRRGSPASGRAWPAPRKCEHK